MFVQEQLFDLPPTTNQNAALKERSGSFVDNMKLPIHRWFRYSAGFSAQWTEEVIANAKAKRVLDPFAGSGTTMLAADALSVPSIGIEAHPFVARIGAAKTAWNQDLEEMHRLFSLALKRADSIKEAVDLTSTPELLTKCYEPESLRELYSLRAATEELIKECGNSTSEYLFLALTSILRECSYVGTAQWQYVLPNKRKKRVSTPYEAFSNKLAQFSSDITEYRERGAKQLSKIIQGDARKICEIVDGEFDLLLTSPPYPNNYDYADATRLEMTFWGEVDSWGGLHDVVRKYLVRSSSQHTTKERLKLDELLEHQQLSPIRDELSKVCKELAEVRETKGGKKAYHTMVAAYFSDMALVLSSARPVMKRGGKMCFVIGDSAPYGVYVPADRWFSSLALASGFKDSTFEKIRDRNTKWKNRKHTVPLYEGRLWINC